MAEYAYLSEGNLEVVPDDADKRVPAALHKRYIDAQAKLHAVMAEMDVRAERPLVVTPDQEPVMRAAVRPGTWIVVRAATPAPADEPAPVASGAPESDGGKPATLTEVEEAVPPAAPKRPALGPCPSRSNLPHAPARYALTEAQSVYFPGRVRVDGICVCGLRIADVKCPHQKQRLVNKRPTCEWCNKPIVSMAGNIDNRAPDGSVNPAIPTLIPIGAAGDDPAVKQAFRTSE
jgi:hypothetical protein